MITIFNDLIIRISNYLIIIISIDLIIRIFNCLIIPRPPAFDPPGLAAAPAAASVTAASEDAAVEAGPFKDDQKSFNNKTFQLFNNKNF